MPPEPSARQRDSARKQRRWAFKVGLCKTPHRIVLVRGVGRFVRRCAGLEAVERLVAQFAVLAPGVADDVAHLEHLLFALAFGAHLDADHWPLFRRRRWFAFGRRLFELGLLRRVPVLDFPGQKVAVPLHRSLVIVVRAHARARFKRIRVGRGHVEHSIVSLRISAELVDVVQFRFVVAWSAARVQERVEPALAEFLDRHLRPVSR